MNAEEPPSVTIVKFLAQGRVLPVVNGVMAARLQLELGGLAEVAAFLTDLATTLGRPVVWTNWERHRGGEGRYYAPPGWTDEQARSYVQAHRDELTWSVAGPLMSLEPGIAPAPEVAPTPPSGMVYH